MIPAKVAVVIDWQNAYRSARDVFGPGTNGNVAPLGLARHLARARVAGRSPGELVCVDIHTGIPSQKQSAVTYAARRRQIAAWTAADPCVNVYPRTLAVRNGVMVEKGVDVAVAIGLVRHLLFDRDCDLAVLVSADTDLLPALELVVAQLGPNSIEVAMWEGPGRGPAPLAKHGHTIRQHKLDEKLYRSLEDLTPYGHQ